MVTCPSYPCRKRRNFKGPGPFLICVCSLKHLLKAKNMTSVDEFRNKLNFAKAELNMKRERTE